MLIKELRKGGFRVGGVGFVVLDLGFWVKIVGLDLIQRGEKKWSFVIWAISPRPYTP